MPSSRRGWMVAFALAVALQLVLLYAPRQGGPALFPHADKVVHALMFAAVGVTGRRAFGRPGLVLALLLVHAVVSEVVQHSLLPMRSGDPLDALSDALGAAVGVALAGAGKSGGREPAYDAT